MAKPVLGKSLCSDWFFLGQDFVLEQAGKFKICNQNSEKKAVNIVILHSETTRKS